MVKYSTIGLLNLDDSRQLKTAWQWKAGPVQLWKMELDIIWVIVHVKKHSTQSIFLELSGRLSQL